MLEDVVWKVEPVAFISVVVEIENVIGGCKLVGRERTIDRHHLHRLHLFQLTNTNSRAEVDPSKA